MSPTAARYWVGGALLAEVLAGDLSPIKAISRGAMGS
jgi:hypothetical protein